MHVDFQTFLLEDAEISVAPEVLRESIRVLAAATDLVGNASKAAFWFRNQPLSDFSDKTAEDLVCEGRAEDVLRYIDMLSAGSAG